MSDVGFFRDGVAAGRLLVRVCASCGVGAFPPMPGCPHCGGYEGDIVESTGTATLYSWTVCHLAFEPSLADDVPYIVGLVDVDVGARVIARVESPVDTVHAGMTLRPSFPRDGNGVTRLVFVPTEEGESDE